MTTKARSSILLALAAKVWTFRARVLAALAFLIVAKLAAVCVPLLLKSIVDALSRPETLLALPVLLLTGYALVRFSSTLFTELRDLVFARASQTTVADVTTRVFSHLHALGARFHANRATGALMRDVELMWAPTRSATRVIEHGVVLPEEAAYTGELPRGLVVVNHLARRGRRLGADVFAAARRHVPLDLIGMGADELDGLGEVRHAALPRFAARYRFFFNPIRYTSLGLAVIEAMLVGLPIVGLATAEMATVVVNGASGYVDTRVERLIDRMRELLGDRAEAARLGAGARARALERFSIGRFVADWNATFAEVCRT